MLGKKIFLVLSVGMFFATITVGVIAAAQLNQIQLPTVIGEAFMKALRDGDYRSAYLLCTPELKLTIGSAVELQTSIEGIYIQPLTWKFSSYELRDINGGSDNFAWLAGEVTLIGPRDGMVRLALWYADGLWLVSGFNLGAAYGKMASHE